MTRAVLVLAAALALALPATATAMTRGELTSYADRVAAVWAGRQDDASGEFLDPHRGRPSSGYGNALIGYALLRAGQRRHSERLIAAGVRGVNATLTEPPSSRGVFDLLAVAAAYNFGRATLAGDHAFAAARPRWAAYLASSGPPNIENSARACIVSPTCFHNHEAVGTTATLEFLDTGVVAPSLGLPATLRAAALTAVGLTEPRFGTGSARIVGPHPRSGLALLSDTGTWPLAYHALSTAMLARSIQLLGDGAPAAARAALKRTALALAGFMAPDGTVAYIGRRQQTVWSLPAAIVAVERVNASAADRAFARLRSAYPLTPHGLPIVPRKGPDAFSPKGVDGRAMAFNGLALYLLNIAADRAPARPRPPKPLPADSDGAFVDRSQAGFAAVRRGDVWFAVHRRRSSSDLRNDFGLVAAKWRSPSGKWVDVVEPRPLLLDSSETAGPVIKRNGKRLPVGGGSIAVHSDGTVVTGGVRFTPVARGVRISRRARAGDDVIYTDYLPRTADPHTAVTSSPVSEPKPSDKRLASCCDLDMRAVRYRAPVRSSGDVTFQIVAAAPRTAGATPSSHTEKKGHNWWPLVAALATAAALGLLLHRRRLRAREETQPPAV